MIERLKVRIPDIDIAVANELIKTAKDRILLRVGLKQTLFPAELESICVEIVTAMYNKHQMKHEGVENENVDVFSMKFVNDLLKQYDPELDEYRRMLENEKDESREKIRFI
ncbi:phage head-tail connector protein [Bacillus sp. FSL K6-3431]|uniref:phage head-tail connector protein n=1 Tax=Bacillus sp. FSL K6-3431 TaxID=2921500 RepID=UPI0030F86C9B